MCSLCRETLKTAGSLGLIHGYYWSILVIGIIPLIVLSIGIYYAHRAYKKKAS